MPPIQHDTLLVAADDPAVQVDLGTIDRIRGNNAEVWLIIENQGVNVVSIVNHDEVAHSALKIPAGETLLAGPWDRNEEDSPVSLLSLGGANNCLVTPLTEGMP